MSEYVLERESVTLDAPPPPRLTPLRRNWRFQLLWSGSALTNLGLEATEVAFPLLILTITGSSALAGVFGFVQVATHVFVSLPAGALVDRWDRRRVLFTTEAIRSAAVGSVAVGLLIGDVSVPLLLVVAVVLGAATAFGAPARMLVVRAVVPSEQLTAALSQEEARAGAAALGGPPVGGALFAVGRAFPFLAAAIGIFVSFILALVVPLPATKAERPAEAKSTNPWSAVSTVFEGLRELLGHRVLRAALALISIFYFSMNATILSLVFGMQKHHTSAGTIGLAISGSAVGMLVGSTVIRRLNKRFSPGRLLIAASTLTTASIALLALPVGPVGIFFLLFTAVLGLPALRVLVDILIFRQTPDHRRGRVIGATIVLVGAGAPVGSLIAGLVLEVAPVPVTLLAFAGCQALITVIGLFNRHLANATWPAEQASAK